MENLWHPKDILKLNDLYLKRKFQHTGRSRRYRNNLILQFQSELWIIYFPNLCKNVKIIRQKDNLELGWEAEIKLLQPKPVKSDFFFLIRARVHIYLDKVSYWIQHIRYCIVLMYVLRQWDRNLCQSMHNICICLWKGLVLLGNLFNE